MENWYLPHNFLKYRYIWVQKWRKKKFHSKANRYSKRLNSRGGVNYGCLPLYEKIQNEKNYDIFHYFYTFHVEGLQAYKKETKQFEENLIFFSIFIVFYTNKLQPFFTEAKGIYLWVMTILKLQIFHTLWKTLKEHCKPIIYYMERMID